jgi:DNA-binding MarR family transcriptional regulator
MKKQNELATRFIELAPLMIRTVKTEIRQSADGRLTHPQFRILSQIHRGLNTVSQIALDHGVSQPAMSKMVNSLVLRGLVERGSRSQDRRQIILKLSPKGLALFRELKEKAAQNFGRKLQKLSNADQTRLHRALDDIAKILNGSSLLRESPKEKPS